MPTASYTASRVHDGFGWLPEKSTIVVNEGGYILDVLKKPLPDTIHLPGVLCPGFVNAHCHLELSHLKGVAPEKTGIVDFLILMSTRRREFDTPDKFRAMEAALAAMRRYGIVAVGDIANSTDTLSIRNKSDIRFHTFIEALGLAPAAADKRFSFYKDLYEQFGNQDNTNKVSLTPHAPYSVSRELFRLIDEFQPDSLISIHNQEGFCENELFRSGGGDLHRLFSAIGLSDFSFNAGSGNSLPTYAGWLDSSHPLLLVHNTFCEAEDIRAVKKRFPKLWFCLCPNANLYIEDRLPDVPLLLAEEVVICIGTDSLASNHQLSVLAELQTLKNNFETLDWEMLLRSGTYNGAEALQMSDSLGSFTKGKKPGVLHLTGLFENKPTVERIV